MLLRGACFALVIGMACMGAAAALEPSMEEQAFVKSLVVERFMDQTATPPFSFVYGGRPSPQVRKDWSVKKHQRKLDKARRERIITDSAEATGLEVRCVGIEYKDYPAMEWVVYFENKGKADTPIIEEVQALDMRLVRGKSGEFILHHACGSDNKTSDFQPMADTLGPKATRRLASEGTSSIGALPFFTIASPDEGLVAAVGWSGSWAAEFARDGGRGVTVRAGMSTTHLLLHPGERIRTPRILVMCFQGDWIRGQNLWRRLLLKHYLPHPGGKPLVGPLTDGNWGAMTEREQIAKINWWRDNKLPLDCFWIDAGWSGKTGPIDSWIENAAIRVPNPEYYPRGLKPVSDAAHAAGMKFLLWTWPNRALPHLGVGKEHPEWLYGEAIDHGNPLANQWIMAENIRLIKEQGIDIYRQDGNPSYPPDSGPDRQGINQIRHFEGFYTFWDALLKKYPNLIIDNCSGGGRKQDLETISRSISLWRSDYQVPNDFDPIGMQCQTYGLSLWVPWSGACSAKTDAYSMRSGYSPALCINWHVYVKRINSEGFDFAGARRLLDEYLFVRPYFYGDFYPLTSCTIGKDQWIAWQFDRPETNSGIVQVFRRPESPYESAQLPLFGLDPTAKYTVTNADTGISTVTTGRELMETGIPVTISVKPGAVLIRYKKN